MSWVNVQCDDAGTIDLKCFVGRRNVVKSPSADETLIESRGCAVSIRGILSSVIIPARFVTIEIMLTTASIGMPVLSLSAKTLRSRSPVVAWSPWLSLNNCGGTVSGVLFIIVAVSIWTLASDGTSTRGVSLPLLADASTPVVLRPLVHRHAVHATDEEILTGIDSAG
jgi:hypothetical protein